MTGTADPFAAVTNCQHSAQSWYRDAGGVHCEDCEDSTNKEGKAMKYRKTALIEAIQWTGDNFDEIQAFNIAGNERPVTLEGSPPQLYIKTLEGRMRSNVGDWIIRGVKGEVYSCAADIFATSYEPVPPQRDDDPVHEG